MRARKGWSGGLGLAVALLLAVAWTAGGAVPVRADDGPAVVNCLNAERGVVTRTVRGQCRGRIVDDAEAARIDDARRAYQRRVFEQPAAPDRRAVRPSPPPVGRAPLPGEQAAAAPRPKGVGSAFFVSATGHLLTNDHVVRECARLTVSPASGETAAAVVVARDPQHDLALLKAEMRPASVARFSAGGNPPTALDVAIIGYPYLGLPVIQPQLTPGRLDGTRRFSDRFLALQLKADVREGNSGGPVLGTDGSVLGIVFAKVHTPNVYRRTGEVVRDVGYAVPSAPAKRFLGMHKVAYRSAAAGAPDADLLGTARAFVARINCY